MTWKKIVAELSVLSILIIILFAVLFLFPSSTYYNIAFYLYAIYYASMLIRYTILFLKEYNNYVLQLDEFFTEIDRARFHWIYFSFFAALAVGTGALLLTFSTNTVHYIIFTFVFIFFYSYFGINFISYAFRFHFVAPVLSPVTDQETVLVTNKPDENHLHTAISKWLQKEGYLQPGLTIEQLARELSTNRTYLSNHINTVQQKSFREWINCLRIEKAKELLLSDPYKTIVDIAHIAGYNDSSNFSKQFVKYTGYTPQAWRKQQLQDS